MVVTYVTLSSDSPIEALHHLGCSSSYRRVSRKRLVDAISEGHHVLARVDDSVPGGRGQIESRRRD